MQLLKSSLFQTKKDFKYFIGYKNDEKVIPLCFLLLRRSSYVRKFDNPKVMCFSVKDEKLLKQCKKI